MSFVAPQFVALAPRATRWIRSHLTRRAPGRWSAAVAGLCLVLLVLVNLPLFLRMPLWPDPILYDLCARCVLRGGVLYRDTFDSCLPGFVWLHLLVRSVAGWSPEALRSADLVVLAANTGILLLFLHGSRCSVACGAWSAVAMVAFYLSTSEFCHCQRDVWMLTPALIALLLRYRQVIRISGGVSAASTIALAGAVEGVFWGLGVWIKPHVLIPALAAWAFGLRLLPPVGAASRRLALRDLVGLLGGGLLAGGVGVAWLWASGAWPSFLDIFFGWNLDYIPRESWFDRTRFFVSEFYPWSLVHFVAMPLAGTALARWLWQGDRSPHTFLALFYASWTLQAVYAQHPFAYHVVAPLFLAVTVTASSGLARSVTFSYAATGFLACVLVLHPMWRPTRLACWCACVAGERPPNLGDRLSLLGDRNVYNTFSYADLDRVAVYLRDQGVASGEVTCYDARTTSIYLQLGIEPSTRFLQMSTVWHYYPRHHAEITRERLASRERFAVSDFTGAGLSPAAAQAIGAAGPLSPPPRFPERLRGEYPWNEPIVFRAGQYAVHRVNR
jgi:hypothetical protein